MVGKISDSMVWCSAYVLGIDLLVAREDDAVIDVVGKICYGNVWCSVFVLGQTLQVLFYVPPIPRSGRGL